MKKVSVRISQDLFWNLNVISKNLTKKKGNIHSLDDTVSIYLIFTKKCLRMALISKKQVFYLVS